MALNTAADAKSLGKKTTRRIAAAGAISSALLAKGCSTRDGEDAPNEIIQLAKTEGVGKITGGVVGSYASPVAFQGANAVASRPFFALASAPAMGTGPLMAIGAMDFAGGWVGGQIGGDVGHEVGRPVGAIATGAAIGCVGGPIGAAGGAAVGTFVWGVGRGTQAIIESAAGVEAGVWIFNDIGSSSIFSSHYSDDLLQLKSYENVTVGKQEWCWLTCTNSAVSFGRECTEFYVRIYGPSGKFECGKSKARPYGFEVRPGQNYERTTVVGVDGSKRTEIKITDRRPPYDGPPPRCA